jgi:D-erythronate 2-dehydrogenase
MRVLIIGAAGMLGGKLVERLVRDGGLGSERISQLTLVDLGVAEPSGDPGFAVQSTVGDLAEPGVAAAIVRDRPDVIFHLAAVVSGEAEDDLEKGYRVNLDATRMLLDAIRAREDGYRPRLVYSSSIAVFGPPLPDVIGDDHGTTPATSYGTQKAMIELLLSDHSRRGFVDGIAIRLPTICVRPGTPNLAASASSRASSASRSTASTRCCRCPPTCATGSRRRARRSASSCTPPRSTAPRSAIAVA